MSGSLCLGCHLAHMMMSRKRHHKDVLVLTPEEDRSALTVTLWQLILLSLLERTGFLWS